MAKVDRDHPNLLKGRVRFHLRAPKVAKVDRDHPNLLKERVRFHLRAQKVTERKNHLIEGSIRLVTKRLLFIEAILAGVAQW